MRINKLIAQATGLSRRKADAIIGQGRVTINGQAARPGQEVSDTDIVQLDHARLQQTAPAVTIVLNKPAGYVVSRNGQGSKTVYDLLPPDLHRLKPVGRLDKDSSGLLLLTTDGQLAERLTHPKYQKQKTYTITLDKPLTAAHQAHISGPGVRLADGLSRLKLRQLQDARHWEITMHEGRNRQIRRTFDALGYGIAMLHRTHFGSYALGDIPAGRYATVG